ncbi:hypothetical protein ABZW96_37420 [Nocardia sp. NPDC004168]|uniref:hypothetical protein n=1 Tax=Nocardia sp. NPDC004168 TaxID=3154452 RepID=UPI0033AD9AA7
MKRTHLSLAVAAAVVAASVSGSLPLGLSGAPAQAHTEKCCEVIDGWKEIWAAPEGPPQKYP